MIIFIKNNAIRCLQAKRQNKFKDHESEHKPHQRAVSAFHETHALQHSESATSIAAFLEHAKLCRAFPISASTLADDVCRAAFGVCCSHGRCGHAGRRVGECAPSPPPGAWGEGLSTFSSPRPGQLSVGCFRALGIAPGTFAE